MSGAHQSCYHVGVGEAIRKEYDQAAEDEKQRSIRCTEEVVRREERARHEQELAAARDDWSIERTRLLQEAQSQQQDAVSREKVLLESSLREEFACALERVMKSHKEDVKQAVRETWREANEVKEQAVAMARREEKRLSLSEASKVVEQVARDRKTAAMKAEQTKKQALIDQEEQLLRWHEEEQDKLRNKMENAFEDKMNSTIKDHRNQLATVQQMLQEERARAEVLTEELRAMTAQRDTWAQQHRDLRDEFASFIDQFPGFKAEFIL